VLGDFLAVLPYLVLGAGVAAWVGTGLSQTFVGVWAGHRLAGPATGVVLSQILCLCSTTDAFVAAAMPVLSLPARLAFLVAGPLFDLKLLWLYRAMYRPEFVRGLWLRVSLGTFVLTVLLGFWL
jgi:uncharacterized membrane protein YraQ (UPF0718 family)